MRPEPVTATAPHEVRHAVMTQGWRSMTFLHWRCDPAVVRPFLPPGIEPDVFDGAAWFGLLPFVMRDVRVYGLRAPYVSTFPETNVRTYGVDRAGRRGIVFLSLDAARAMPVAVARAAYRLPYVWSSMRVRRDVPDEIEYSSTRLLPRSGGATSHVRVRVGAAIDEPSRLEVFLTARWWLHVRCWGQTVRIPASHEPWPLHRATVLTLDDQLVPADGLPAPDDPPHVLFSPGVTARIGPPQLGGRAVEPHK